MILRRAIRPLLLTTCLMVAAIWVVSYWYMLHLSMGVGTKCFIVEVVNGETRFRHWKVSDQGRWCQFNIWPIEEMDVEKGDDLWRVFYDQKDFHLFGFSITPFDSDIVVPVWFLAFAAGTSLLMTRRITRRGKAERSFPIAPSENQAPAMKTR
jgi:hypothetical protein